MRRLASLASSKLTEILLEWYCCTPPVVNDDELTLPAPAPSTTPPGRRDKPLPFPPLCAPSATTGDKEREEAWVRVKSMGNGAKAKRELAERASEHTAGKVKSLEKERPHRSALTSSVGIKR